MQGLTAPTVTVSTWSQPLRCIVQSNCKGGIPPPPIHMDDKMHLIKGLNPGADCHSWSSETLHSAAYGTPRFSYKFTHKVNRLVCKLLVPLKQCSDRSENLQTTHLKQFPTNKSVFNVELRAPNRAEMFLVPPCGLTIGIGCASSCPTNLDSCLSIFASLNFANQKKLSQ